MKSRRIEMMGRGGRRRKQFVNDIKKRENIGNLRSKLCGQIVLEKVKELQ